ncbi:hypothetical protein [Sphingobacterium sp. E70]
MGAGVAGPILALQLKKMGFDVELFEARSEDKAKEGAFWVLHPMD